MFRVLVQQRVEQQADATSALDILTLVVAIAGAVTGVLALVLQGLFFRHSGPRIRPLLQWAWVDEGGAGAITLPINSPFTGPPEPGYSRLMLAVEVRNRGRAATNVERVAVDLENGITFHQPTPDVGPGFPVRLEAESSETWYLEPHAIRAAAEVSKVEPRVRAVVTLGSGRQHRTPRVSIA